MADKYPGLKSGPAGAETLVENRIAAAAIKIGGAVKDTTAGTGELDARVTPGTATNSVLAGIVVQGDNRGTYGGSDEYAAAAAGQGVGVAIIGRVKVKVDGSTASIAIGDPLTVSTIDTGLLQKAGSGAFVVARARQASTAYGDYILAEVTREGIL